MKLFRNGGVNSFLVKQSTLVYFSVIIFFAILLSMSWFLIVFERLSNNIEQNSKEIALLYNNKELQARLQESRETNQKQLDVIKKHFLKNYSNFLDTNQILFLLDHLGLELLNFETDNNNPKQTSNLSNLIPISFSAKFFNLLEFFNIVNEEKKLYGIEKLNIERVDEETNMLRVNCIFNPNIA